MNLLKLILVYLLLSGSSHAIETPKLNWLSEQDGLIIVPESIIMHFDNIYYFSMGVQLGLTPDSSVVGSAHKPENCTYGEMRKRFLKDIEVSAKEFFDSLSSHFEMLDDHYCSTSDLDCFLQKDALYPTKKASPNHTNVARKTRSLPIAIATFAGLASIGASLYNMISSWKLKNHLEDVESHINKMHLWLKKNNDFEQQYHRLSEEVFLKAYHGTINNEKRLAMTLCNVADKAISQEIHLEYELFLDSYKNGFRRALDGEVDDFLISYKFLLSNILSKDVFKDTAYKVDPGLFYVTSKSVLTHVDKKNRIAYFLITTPILNSKDISPLYNVHNLGWWQDDTLVKWDIPSNFHYLTDGKRLKIIETDTQRCDKMSGIYVCPIQEATSRGSTQCLQKILKNKPHPSCKTKVKKTTRECTVHVTKVGVGMIGCSNYTKVTKFRDIHEMAVKKMDPTKMTFLNFTDFYNILINDRVIQTRGTIGVVLKKAAGPPHEVDLTELEHLMIPGVEHDLTELREYRNRYEATAAGFFVSNTKKSRWWVYLISLVSVVLVVVLSVKYYRHKKKANKRAKNLGDLLRQRRTIVMDR